MKNSKLIALSAALFLGANVFAQLDRQALTTENGMFQSFVKFDKNAPAFNFRTPQEAVAALQLDPKSGLQLLNSETDALGFQHFRLQQTYNGFPIENSMYLVHVRNGKIESMNGELISQFPETVATQRRATISPQAAINYATNYIGASVYKWQMPSEEQFIKREAGDIDATFYPTVEQVWLSGVDKISPNLRLAYKIDVYAHEPMSRDYVYVDANTGEIIGKKNRIHTSNANGTAVTGYSGTVTITADMVSSTSYRLRETGRGNGIETYNMRKGTSYTAAVDFTDTDNYWNNVNTNKDQYATDAHWGTEKTYDYFKNTYNRNSIDNAGFAIKSYVHYSTNYFNAFWDGTRMTYGDGSSTNGNKPLTGIDVCGHEITHGLTEFTANLVYSYESGAMNEGFSDIFGNTIEAYARPSQNSWLIGEDFYTIRSMSNPNTYQQPDTYQGTYWATGTADNGGVHTNSGVLNYWYYLLCVGKSGTNDKGTAFNVTSITMPKAAAIAYRTLTVYLTSSSNYAAARTASIQAATDLYGAGSAEVTQTTNAWIAVGVGAATTPPPATCDTYEANETLATAKTIATGTNINAAINSSTDIDWFKFTNSSTTPNISLSLTGLAADFELVLYNSAGTQLAISENSNTTAEAINYTTTTVGTYYVKVFGYGGANSSTCYTLKATLSGTTTPPPTTCSDVYESNGSLSAAKTIAVNTNITALISSSTDKDFFKFTNTSTSKNIKVTLSGLAADYDLRLYNSAGTQLAISENSSTTAESITYNNGAVGTYYLQVYGYNGANSTACYTLRANISSTAFFGNGNEEVLGDAFVIQNINADKTSISGETGFFPNPASNQLTIVQEAEQDTETTVFISDMMGRVVFTQSIQLLEGRNQIALDLPKIANGIYFLKIGNNPAQKLILQN